MYCRKCGKAIPDDSVYCPYCGLPTDPGMRKKENGVRKLIFKAVLSTILVIAVLVCVVIGIRRSAAKKDAIPTEAVPPQTTVSTLPPETTGTVTESTEAPEETQNADSSDPWLHVDTMEDAVEILGFGLEAPEIVKDFEAPWINVAPDCSNLWVSYHRYTQEHDPMYYDKIITVGRSIYIVKYPCPDGAFYVSPEVKQKLINAGGNDVVLVMNNTEVVEANWAADGYAYSITFENMGLTPYTVVPIIAQTH